ncbi:LytR/AlgR family response regulator transcription factor [Lacrimispora sp. AGF001]|uniref:LytR/AlgR family response regulator transcription factor n=1 Tax=Lacrimispora sp. AGF001 TaxID=3401631 RepID=UPI003B42CDD5
MIPIYICEDSEDELKGLQRLINKIIIDTELQDELEIVCATPDPYEILNKIKDSMQTGIYFLDVDLGPGIMNGIQLGINIKTLDSAAYIVMVTTHGEAAPLTFKYKIGAKDYILKEKQDEVKTRVMECILQAHTELSDFNKNKYRILTLMQDYTMLSMFQNQVYCFEVIAKTQRKIRVYEQCNMREVSSTLQEIKKQLDNTFFQCHKSYIINMEHVMSINHEQRQVVLDNGKEVPVSFRNLKKIESFFQEFCVAKAIAINRTVQ